MPSHSRFYAMDFSEYSILFHLKARKADFTEKQIEDCLLYAKKLHEQSLPIIYDTQHLSLLVGYKKSYIKKALQFTSYFYRTFDIDKKNGKKRTITEPLPSLKEIQYWILYSILEKIDVHNYSKAYIKGKSIKDNVRFHKNKKYVLTLDINNFFPSIKLNLVTKVFSDIGYSPILSNLLAKLCCLDDRLPQGAPTSPLLSNIIMKSFDEAIRLYCNPLKIMYTRYADDLTFSGDFHENEIIEIVKNELSKMGLDLNYSKIRLMGKHERQIVTGITVNSKAQVPPAERNSIRMAVHCIKKYGLENHMQRMKITQNNYLKHLLGKVNYVLFINGENSEFREYQKYIRSILPDTF